MPIKNVHDPDNCPPKIKVKTNKSIQSSSMNLFLKKNNVIYGLFNKNCGTENKTAVGEKIRKHDSYANYLARKVRNNNTNC
jgi:transcription elongation factor Elf1